MRLCSVSAVAGIFAGAASLCAVSPAAADGANWTGGYVGGHIGWISGAAAPVPVAAASTSVEVFSASPADGQQEFRMSDVIGGVHAGYNIIQRGAYVFGVEGDFDWTRIHEGRSTEFSFEFTDGPNCDGSEFETCRTVTSNFSGSNAERRSLDWLASLRARVGVLPDDNILLYLTGGVAFTEAKVASSFSSSFVVTGTCSGPSCISDDTFTFSSNDGEALSARRRLAGYVIGGGVEMKFSTSLSGRFEYLYYDFGRQTFDLGGTPAAVDIHENVFRIGLSYYFD